MKKDKLTEGQNIFLCFKFHLTGQTEGSFKSRLMQIQRFTLCVVLFLGFDLNKTKFFEIFVCSNINICILLSIFGTFLMKHRAMYIPSLKKTQSFSWNIIFKLRFKFTVNWATVILVFKTFSNFVPLTLTIKYSTAISSLNMF